MWYLFSSTCFTGNQYGCIHICNSFSHQVKKGKMTDSEKNAILDRITIGTKEIFKDADLIIEAVKENMQIKKKPLKN